MADRLDSLAEVICFATHDIDRQVFYARVQIRSRKRERSLSDPSIAIDENLPKICRPGELNARSIVVSVFSRPNKRSGVLIESDGVRFSERIRFKSSSVTPRIVIGVLAYGFESTVGSVPPRSSLLARLATLFPNVLRPLKCRSSVPCRASFIRSSSSALSDKTSSQMPAANPSCRKWAFCIQFQNFLCD